jgi:hypothetical protein
MQLLNYTGKQIGLSNEGGSLVKVFPSDGNARCVIQNKKKAEVDMITIYKKEYGRVEGLPDPDRNLQKLYIVTRDVAEAAGPRFDLLVPEELVTNQGYTYYKYLVNV